MTFVVSAGRTLRCAGLGLVLLLAGAEAQAGQARGAPQTPEVNPDAQVVAEFQERVKEYQALRKKLEADLPDLAKQGSAEQIHQRHTALERAIRQARAGARQGDLLTPPLRAFIRRQLARVLGGPDGRKVRAALLDENVRGIRLRINGRYPADAPLTTVPPQILLSLPRLPRELEFRFVGSRLALLDVEARTVLDIMDNAYR